MEPESSFRSPTAHPEREKGKEGCVWLKPEDECLSHVQKRALRDEKVALMLREMRTAMHVSW